MGSPIPAPFPASSEGLRSQRKRKRKKEKREASSQAASPTSYLVGRRRGRKAIPSRENDPKEIACSESGVEDTVNTHEAKVFMRKNKAGEGCEEQERQLKLHAT